MQRHRESGADSLVNPISDAYTVLARTYSVWENNTWVYYWETMRLEDSHLIALHTNDKCEIDDVHDEWVSGESHVSYFRRGHLIPVAPKVHRPYKGKHPRHGKKLKALYKKAYQLIPRVYTDRVRVNLTPTRDCYNPVVHVRRSPVGLGCRLAHVVPETLPTPAPYSPDWRVFAQDIGTFYGRFGPQAFMNDGKDPVGIYPRGISWNGLVNTVGEELDTIMSTRLSCLMTLKDLSSTVRMIKNPIGLVKLLRRKEFRTLSLRKFLSDAKLEYDYGWRQMVQDLTNFLLESKKVDDRLKQLEAQRAQWHRIAARQFDVGYYSLDTPTFTEVGGHVTLKAVDCTCKRTAVFSLERRPIIPSTLDAHMAALGLDNLSAVIWDAIPFSFVMDWFVHLRNGLRFSGTDWHAYGVRKVGYSVKEEFSLGLTIESNAASTIRSMSDTSFAASGNVPVLTKYTRTPGFPPDSGTVGVFGRCRISALLDGAALILQRV